MMLDRQIEETRSLVQQNKDETTMSIKTPELNEVQSEEGNYSRIVGLAEPPVVGRNN